MASMASTLCIFVFPLRTCMGSYQKHHEVKTGGSTFIDEVFSYVLGLPVIGISFFVTFLRPLQLKFWEVSRICRFLCF